MRGRKSQAIEEDKAVDTADLLEAVNEKDKFIYDSLQVKYTIPTEDRKVVLVCKDSAFVSKRMRHIIQPPVDKRTGKVYTGQPVFSEEEKRFVVHVVTPETTRVLQGRVVFDLSNPVDAIDWQWVQKHPYVNPESETALWRIEDAEKDSKEKVSKEKELIKLKNKIFEYPLSTKRKLVRIFGGNSDANEYELESFLLDVIDKNVKTANGKTFAQVSNNSELLDKMYFAYLLIDKAEISINLSNYYYKEKMIATDLDGYLLWLDAPEQRDWVSVIAGRYSLELK